MKTLTGIFLVLATLHSFTLAAELAPETLIRAKARIETLLGNRRGASPTPVNPANPFVVPASAPVVQDGQPPTIEAPTSKAVALARIAATLNVSGYLVINGVPHLTINRKIYRQNEIIPVRESGGVSFVTLKAITETDFTLELDGSELQQKHTVK